MNKQDMKAWIKALNLEPHEEGGYFRQVICSEEEVEDHRPLYTSILFLLSEDNPSRFHRLTVDEVWYFHTGNTVNVHTISPEGNYQVIHLGLNVENGEVLQARVPKGTVFGSTVEEGFGIVSCMCAPGFEYEDFELMNKADLLAQYPQYENIIQKLGVDN